MRSPPPSNWTPTKSSGPNFPLSCSSPMYSHRSFSFFKSFSVDYYGETDVGEGHGPRTYGEVAQKFLKSLWCWNHGYCLPGTPVRQALRGCSTVPPLISTPCVKIGGPTSELEKPVSVSCCTGFHTHWPLHRTSFLSALTSFSFFFPEWGSVQSMPSVLGSGPLGLCPMTRFLAFLR